MDFDDTPEEAQWRTKVRTFIAENREQLGERSTLRGFEHESARERQALQYEGGLIGVAWPEEFGGQGGTHMQQAIVDQELARADVPGPINIIGLGMCGPTIIAHGTPEQHQRYLRPLLRGEEIWCQLFSEPASGSDLAALRTKAVQESDGTWRLNGQKVWTTLAHISDFGIVLARTDPDLAKHKGLTMFIINMSAPGVTVRPLRQMNGTAEFNEVYLDDVVLQDSDRLGGVGEGWSVALTTLMSERLSLGGGGSDIGVPLDRITAHIGERVQDLDEGAAALARQRFGRAYVDALGVRFTGYRQLSKVSQGEMPGPDASAGKLAGTRVAKDLIDMSVRLLDTEAVYDEADPDGVSWQGMMITLPGMTIAGGTDEVLRNILGEFVLGLPAEPRADKGMTFRESLEAQR